MKAAYIKKTGPPESIQIGELPDPTAGPGQVLIRCEAVAVNPIDTYIRSGAVAMPLPSPFVIGCDLAGTVAAVGEGVTGFRPGDRVWSTNQGLLGRQGTFAELAAVDTDWVFATPDGVESTAAAACALVGVTAHIGLTRAKLRANDTVLVIGGSGGVGSMVIQIAKACGANVIATAGSEEKCQLAESLGADFTINYNTESITKRTKTLAPEGVNVFWETRREPDFDTAVELLAERGRMVLMAGREARPEFPVGPFYVKECSLHGFAMFKATPDEMRLAADDIHDWLADEQLKPHIGQRMKLTDAVEAHRLQEEATLAGKASLSGKIVLEI
ncbi:NADPH:quinone reductase [Roseimaritima ulvae]|uniref:Zinc-type alcohol dehydrogenase-like protein n=1 Tax=Roseimaritima ulvae TaxID=980254 RepID=A0A5B9QYE7_9BACT|nr:NADPH:quinone reductase [Roseimaritima ulvae]QEG38991.1 Zinc-type alcohol dehydrogenase-like protein [Roseimaritima ulvae]